MNLSDASASDNIGSRSTLVNVDFQEQLAMKKEQMGGVSWIIDSYTTNEI